MIVNSSCDNSYEGDYLTVKTCRGEDQFTFDLPEFSCFSDTVDLKKWIAGWGTGSPYYDAGVENLRRVVAADAVNGTLTLGNLYRGKGFPANGDRIVFWNLQPSGFIKSAHNPLIGTEWFHSFNGNSAGLADVVYDSTVSKWVMLIVETDASTSNTFLASSANLVDWQPAAQGLPVFTSGLFSGIDWAGYDRNGRSAQAAIPTEVIYHQGKWFIFVYAYNEKGAGSVGVVTTECLTKGPYYVGKVPLLTPGTKDSWDARACQNAKVTPYKGRFVMFYAGEDNKGTENVGTAVSGDLLHWNKYKGNPVIKDHYGWRSALSNSEPSYVSVSGDSIYLMVAGKKEFREGFWHRHIAGQQYTGVSGNVDDTQIGVYMSRDEGRSFIAHINNPVFCNDYSDPFENEHLGPGISIVETDTADYLFYFAKSSFKGMKYNIHLRVRSLKK
ncbi:MAG: hypothetical protein KJ607_13875 [Bacteroidetes bacterium]|nr:hypothetical protein [Bacteroidota bacterium]